ncbi:hypothetical protein EBR25_13175 [bacterium]|nr:hypothetical protein [bacterium]
MKGSISTSLVSCFLIILFSTSVAFAQISPRSTVPTSVGKISQHFFHATDLACSSLPCVVATQPEPLFVDGTVTNSRSGPHLQLQFFTVGGPFATLDLLITQQGSKTNFSGTLTRVEPNPWNLTFLNESFNDLVPIRGPIPPIRMQEAVLLGMLGVFMDLNNSGVRVTGGGRTALAITTGPLCKDEIQDALGSSGPLYGLGPIPWFTPDEVEACAIRHDECYRNNPASETLRCDRQLADCVNGAAGLIGASYTFFSTGSIIAWHSLFGGGITESPEPCKCRWKLTDDLVKKLLVTPHVQLKVGGSSCCTDRDCTDNSCTVSALDSAGTPVISWEGSCEGEVSYHLGRRCNVCHGEYTHYDQVETQAVNSNVELHELAPVIRYHHLF